MKNPDKEKDYIVVDSMDIARAHFWNSIYGSNFKVLTKEDAAMLVELKKKEKGISKTT
jgi:hypothetical protein